MSLVGPRPERPEFVKRFTREVHRYPDRHRVKSGITGWAQVNGLRGQTSIADRVEWDNHYIRNWSLGLELRTLILTIAEVMRFRDSARSGPEALCGLTARVGRLAQDRCGAGLLACHQRAIWLSLQRRPSGDRPRSSREIRPEGLRTPEVPVTGCGDLAADF
jgi:hypothetical protein